MSTKRIQLLAEVFTIYYLMFVTNGEVWVQCIDKGKNYIEKKKKYL